MADILLLIGGLLVGTALGWFIQGLRQRERLTRVGNDLRSRIAAAESTERELRDRVTRLDDLQAETAALLQETVAARTAAETRLEEMQRTLAEQKQWIAGAEQRLRETFGSLSLEALQRNRSDFARQADDRLRPLTDALQRYETHLREVEQQRQQTHGTLSQQLKSLSTSQRSLDQQTNALVTALRSPQVTGSWGELTLRNAVEVAGLSRYCDFQEQVSIAAEQGGRRPDLVVRLPGDRAVVVDAKAPTAALLDVNAADGDAEREAAVKRYTQAIRQHMRDLGGKQYERHVASAVEFVVMFIPGESFFATAVAHDTTLIEDALRRNVILASPTTLIALLRTVGHSWQQQEMLDNAERIGQTARELYDRVAVFAEHLTRVGEQLRRATDSYNSAVGSWQSRLLPVGRRIHELGIRSKDVETLALRPIELTPRDLPESAKPPKRASG